MSRWVAGLADTYRVAAPTGVAATDQAAIQAQIDAAATAGGGVVVLQAGDYAMNAELILKDRVLLRGKGIRVTRLLWAVDLGSGTYAVRQDAGAGIQEDAPALDSLTVQGPVDAALPGGTHADMDGWRIGRNVDGTDVKVRGFRAGAVIYGDHNTMTSCSFNDNYYNVLYHGTPLTKGNQYWIACNFTGAGFASIAVDGTNGIDGSVFLGGHSGFAPYAFYRFDAGGTGTMINACILDGLSFEACGNSAIFDAVTTAATTINHTTIINPGFSWSTDASTGGWARRLAGQPRDYAVVARGFARTFIRGGAAPFSDGAVAAYNIIVGGSFVGLELEQSYPLPTCVGVANNVKIDTGEAKALYKKAISAVALNDLLEVNGSGVAPYNGRAFAGVALTAAAINAYVPVAYEGRVTISNHTTAVTTAGVPLKPATGALNKVAPASGTGSGGYSFGGAVTPDKWPIVGYSDSDIVASSTTGKMYLRVGGQDDRTYVTPGAVTALPTASSTYRGQMLRVEGAAGVADGLYVCMKDAANAYSWKSVTLA